MKIQVQRVYDVSKDSFESGILVDRLWPRGISKEKLARVPWLKELAPTKELRKWFHEDKNKRWEEFNEKYISELERNRSNIKNLFSSNRRKIILLTGVKDVEKSHIPALKEFLSKI